MEENDNKDFLSTKASLAAIEVELSESIDKFKKIHEIYTEYCLSLNKEKKKLEKEAIENHE